MAGRSYQEGVYVDYTPTVDIPGGTVVVQGLLFGFATEFIAANVQGALRIRGCDWFPKDGAAMAVGIKLYWDATNFRLTATVGSNIYAGKSARAALAGDTQVLLVFDGAAA